MPSQYDGIKAGLLAKGMDDKTAKSHAARIFIAKGKMAKGKPGSPSSRAKALQKD